MNYILVYLSYHFSRLVKVPLHAGMPVALSIEPTTSCNLRCPQCPSGLRSFSRETGMLSVELFRKVIDQASPHAFYLTLYFQGEPFLNPLVYEMIRYAKGKNMMVVTSTNAHYLTDSNCEKIISSGLDKLIISIDGATQESYSKYRVGGKLDTVIEGVKRLQEMKGRMKKSTPVLSVQTVVFSSNEKELDELKILAEKIGADEIKFKSAQLYDFSKGSNLMPDDESLSRYVRAKDGSYKLSGEVKNECWRMWSSTVVTWDGKVVPCCFDKDASYRMGDLTKTALGEIWNSSIYNSFRERVLKSRTSIDICTNCSEGSKVFVK